MTQPGFRFTIGRLMALIAVVAVLLALWPLEFGPLVLIFLALGGIMVALVRTRGMNWVRAAAWAFSACPLLLVAFGILTRMAGGWNGGYIGRLAEASLFGAFLAFPLSCILTIIESADATLDGVEQRRPVVGLILFALLAWPLAVGSLFVTGVVGRFLDRLLD